MENKKSYRSIYQKKREEVHTPEEILQAFDNSFCACFALAEDCEPGAKARLFGMIWDIHPEAIIVEADLFVVQSEPVAARDQYLVISKNSTKESNALLAQCIEESGVITSAWYIRRRKQGDIKTCYHHVLGSDKPAVLHKANLLLDGANLLLTVRHLSSADHVRMKVEETLDCN